MGNPEILPDGTIIEGNTEFYSSRLKRKERGKTMVEELLHDRYHQEILQEKVS